MNRERKIYKSIGEVSKEISISTHTLRFWEKEFKQIKPITFDGNRRYYTEKDIDVLKTRLYNNWCKKITKSKIR